MYMVPLLRNKFADCAQRLRVYLDGVHLVVDCVVFKGRRRGEGQEKEEN
jgi:hypothetical protein